MKHLFRLLVGGSDGSVTMSVVANVAEDELDATRKMLRSLPSR